LFDALQSTITRCLKCKEKVTNPLAQINLIENDYGIAFELFFACYQYQEKSLWCFQNFIFILKDMKKKKISQHFMFDARP